MSQAPSTSSRAPTVTRTQTSPNGQNVITSYSNGTSSFSGPTSSGGAGVGNPINAYNPNTGALLTPGQSVQIGNTGNWVTQGTAGGTYSNQAPLNYNPNAATGATSNIGATDLNRTGTPIPTYQQPPFNSTGVLNGSTNAANNAVQNNNAAISLSQQKTDIENKMGTDIQSRIDALLGNKLPSQAEAYQQAQQESGILQKQQIANDLSGQLNMIQANAQASQISLEGQGRGIVSGIIGGQQAQIAREAAIQALPVSAQLQYAQGNLQMAQQNLDTLFKIKTADAQAQYQYKKDIINTVYDFADKQDQRKLDDVNKQLDYEKQQHLVDIKDMRAISSQVMSNGAPASVIGAVANAKTYDEAVKAAGKYGGDYLKADLLKQQIVTEKAQQSNYYANIAKTKAEAAKTIEETKQLGTPGGGKPATDTQITNAGYAARIEQANQVIDSNSDVFKKMNIAQFKLIESNSPAANTLLSPEQQQAGQAMKSFITAKLRKESGAAISPTEFADARATYFPVYGDSDAVLAQKKITRDLVLQNNIAGSGSAYKANAVASSAPNPFSKALGKLTDKIPGTSIMTVDSSGSFNFILPK